MKDNKYFILTGLQFGDEGKGSFTDAFVRKFDLNLVVKFNGGAQAAHNVVLPSGEHHTFHTYGSGTLAGVPTVLSHHYLIDPFAIQDESVQLSKLGIDNPYKMLLIDGNAKIVTPWHVWKGREREAKLNHGTCGMGIGEVMYDSIMRPDGTLYVRDLFNGTFEDKLIETAKHYNDLDTEINFESIIQFFTTWRTGIQVISSDDVLSKIHENSTLFEGSQGVLLDQDFGFHPHTTWSTTTSSNAMELINEVNLGLTSPILPVKVGLIRSYMTRHGVGPFPTENKALSDLYPELHNSSENIQGVMRIGRLNLTLLEYAIQANKGIDYLAVSYMDTVKPDSMVTYGLHIMPQLPKNFDDQMANTRLLESQEVAYLSVPSDFFLSYVEEWANAPVLVTSSGVTYQNKQWYN